MNRELSEKLAKIKLILLDVDGTLTDGGIYVNMDGSQFKRFHAHDGEGIRRALDAGIEVGIISAAGLAKPLIESRAKMLGISRVHAERSDKQLVAEKWANEMGISADEVAYMGDDIMDRKVMEWCGVAVGPANSHSSILNTVDAITKLNGGSGAAREFIDWILEAKGLQV